MAADEFLPTRHSAPIAHGFWLVLFVLVAAMSVMGYIGFNGFHRINQSVDALEDSVGITARDTVTREVLLDLQAGMQVYVVSEDALLEEQSRARVDRAFARLAVAQRNPGGIQRQLARIEALWRDRAFDITGAPAAIDRRKGAMARHIGALLGPLVGSSDRAAAVETRRAAAAAADSRTAYSRARNLLAAIFICTLLLGIALIVWLIRKVVPRSRDDLVRRHESEREYRRAQGEFVDAMQVTASEEEAHSLIKRHLERSIGLSKVVVMSRNNSDDRLEARTPVEPGSAVAVGLDGASPRSCLAVRFGRRHDGDGGRDSLLSCEVCGKVPDLTTCDPLLVGGEVIGAVLVNHETPLDAPDELRVHDSVTQAAPVLANLRNLAIAEMRASTDALTGLANNRAVQDNLKRMVAQAARSRASMAVVLLDLDRFKQINDTYGHGRGDEVLAAAALAMNSAVRVGDFVGRYGGEEFIIALPDTDLEGALTAAEKIRIAVSQVSVPTVDRAVTASLGVAVLPADGLDTESLLRNADRALYDAKSKGRNRVECAAPMPELVDALV